MALGSASHWSAAARTMPTSPAPQTGAGAASAAGGGQGLGDDGDICVGDVVGHRASGVAAGRLVEQGGGDDEPVDLGVLLDQREVGVDGAGDEVARGSSALGEVARPARPVRHAPRLRRMSASTLSHTAAYRPWRSVKWR